MEIPGIPEGCVCKYGRLFRYCYNLVIPVSFPKATLLNIAQSADLTYSNHRLIYMGQTQLQTLAQMDDWMKPSIRILSTRSHLETDGLNLQQITDYCENLELVPCDKLNGYFPGFIYMLIGPLVQSTSFPI